MQACNKFYPEVKKGDIIRVTKISIPKELEWNDSNSIKLQQLFLSFGEFGPRYDAHRH